jgi:DNA polymerase III subunit gamma/tau
VAYVSLYRRYRPQSFTDVVGQEHVTRTLINAIEEDRLHHAYLFTGPRGTGKTSTARILAKAVNCEQGPTPSPCNTCGSCTAITDGSSIDVIELDMASHGGVDDARELRDRALFAPAAARRKVYILDEVHMASTAAFNALLKLVEEPPAHVLFAMATTDPQKVIPTILSRVQRLDLRRVSASDVGAHVRAVCAAEGYTIDDGAVDAVVRAGDGSVRDTLSVLEQVLAFAGTEVTAPAVAQVLGQTPAERVVESVERLAARDLAGLLGLVQGLLDQGHDLRRFTLDLVQHLRDLLVLQAAPDRPDLVDATDDRRRLLLAQTRLLPAEALLRAVDLLAGTVAEQRQGSPRLPLELTLAKLAVPGADGDVAELADRVARLEAGRAGTPARRAPTAEPVATREPSAPPAASGPAAEDSSSPAEDGDTSLEVDARVPARDDHRSADRIGTPAAAPERPAAAQPAPAPATPPDGAPAEPVPPRPASAHPAPAPAVTAPAVTAPAATAPAATEPAATEPAAPEPAAPEPGATGPAASDPPATEPAPADAAPADDLAGMVRAWPGALEVVRQRSRRLHAIFEPAVPVAYGNGVLTLRYATRYASFHAANARRGESAAVLQDALEHATGQRVRIDVRVEGEDLRRRPTPPLVTPPDARTAVLDDSRSTAPGRPEAAAPATAPPAPTTPLDPSHEDGPTPEEEAEVREAEESESAPIDPDDVDALLQRELGAELVEEQPARDGHG